MTCIVGLVDKDTGAVWLGGDSAGVADLDLTVRADKKVFRIKSPEGRDEFILGFTTSFRMGQLLRYALKPPSITGDLDEYMCTTFIDAVRQCLKDGGYAKKTNEEESAGQFLVGVRHRLFTIHDDYQVGETLSGYDAVGCGENIAKGAMFANTSLSPKQRIEQALQAAEAHSAGVRAPFHIEKLEGSNVSTNAGTTA